jgi:hydroxymethylpyrimidine/phosphomethylpyrimidine kinase
MRVAVIGAGISGLVAARELVDAGAGAALVKGGHLEGDDVVDILWDGSEEQRWERPRLQTRNTHGTGCTLSAAVAAGLARGWPLTEAVDQALAYLARAIATAPDLGQGHGPVNHFAPVQSGG